MADCLTLLLTGNILTGITCTWTNVIGLWFYAIMLMTLEIVVFIKTDNITGPALLGVTVGILMIATLPTAMAIIPTIILGVNLAVVAYKLFRSQKD